MPILDWQGQEIKPDVRKFIRGIAISKIRSTWEDISFHRQVAFDNPNWLNVGACEITVTNGRVTSITILEDSHDIPAE